MRRSTEVVRLATIRRLMPEGRALNYQTALDVAERQAHRLVSAWGNGERRIRGVDILTLARIEIVQGDAGPDNSGLSRYRNGRWEVVLSANDPVTRQRFTLAHELKHIIDAGCDESQTYRLLKGIQIERICDHFAACLLMSERSIYALWGDGVRTPSALARACDVSVSAMVVRLSVLGLKLNSGNHKKEERSHQLSQSIETDTITSQPSPDGLPEGVSA